MKLRVIGVIPGHRGVQIETLDVQDLVLAEALAINYAKNPHNIVDLLDKHGFIIKRYSK